MAIKAETFSCNINERRGFKLSAGGFEWVTALCAGLHFAPLRSAGCWFWIGLGRGGWQAGRHELEQRITEALRVTFGDRQSVGGQNRGAEATGKESGD